MWAVVIVVGLVVVVAVLVALFRRPRGHDVHSVRNYNQALGTLEHLSERIGPPVVRPIARQAAPDAPPGATDRVVPPVPVRGTDQFPDPDAPIVFDDARPANRTRIAAAGQSGSSARSDRAQRMALDSMNRRRRGGTGIFVAVVVVVILAALAFIGRHKPHDDAHASTSTTAVSGTGGGTGRDTTTSRPKPTQTTRPTPTTLPKQFVATTTSSTGSSADYTIPDTSFQIAATGTGPCWVQVKSVSTGNTEWEGVLQAGSTKNIQATGATTVDFGTPALTLAVDAVPVVLPSPLHAPFSATFTPSASAVASALAAAAAASPTTTTTSSSVPG